MSQESRGPNWELANLAFAVLSAISEGVNTLCALLEWNDAGAIGDPPVDSAKLSEAMSGLEGAFREVLHGGRLPEGGPPVVEDDLPRVIEIERLSPAWPSRGALSPEVVTLAEACVSALHGGASWRELMAGARLEAALARS